MQAREFAESVLRMKDNQQYTEMYRDKFGAKMRQAVTEDQWVARAQSADRASAALKSRELESSGYSLLARGYKFRYKAQYERFSGFEEVHVAREGEDFKVVGIWLKAL